MFYYSKQNRYGLGILAKRSTVISILNVVRYSMLQLKSKTDKTNIIRIYAPTADKSDQELEGFYSDLDTGLRTTRKCVTTIIMIGDFNEKVGKRKVEEYVGEYGLSDRKERGDRSEFSQEII